MTFSLLKKDTYNIVLRLPAAAVANNNPLVVALCATSAKDITRSEPMCNVPAFSKDSLL